MSAQVYGRFVLLMPLVLSTDDALFRRFLDSACGFARNDKRPVLSTERSPLSFRPSGSERRNLPGIPPNSRTGKPVLCAVSRVAVRHRPKSAHGAREEVL